MTVVAQPRRTEREYRQIPTDSASTIKDFLVDPKKYFNKYVMGEPVEEEEDTKSTIIGSLVHCLLLEPQHFDEKYYVSALEEKPTEKMLEFCLSLYRHTMGATDEQGVVTKEFSIIAMDAYNETKPGNWKFDTLMNKFADSISESYYEELLLTKPKNLQIVTLNDMKIAEGIIDTLKSDDNVGEIFNMESDDDITIYSELQLEGPEYKIYDLPMKGMVDKLSVNHKTRSIMPYDLKVTWEPQNFMEGYYLYRRSYLQIMVYYKLLEIWADLNGYGDYELRFPIFIVVDSGNFYKPLTYVISSEQITGANNGFTNRGKYYKGLQEVITDLKWARDMNEWKISRENYMNKGLVTIKTV